MINRLALLASVCIYKSCKHLRATLNYAVQPLNPIVTGVFKGFCLLCRFSFFAHNVHPGFYPLPSLSRQLHFGVLPLPWPNTTLRIHKCPSSDPKMPTPRVIVRTCLPSVLIYVVSPDDFNGTLFHSGHSAHIPLDIPTEDAPQLQTQLPPNKTHCLLHYLTHPHFLLSSLLENDTYHLTNCPKSEN